MQLGGQGWQSLSISGRTQNILGCYPKIPPTFIGNVLSCKKAGTSKDLRTAFKVSVMLTLLAVAIQVKSDELAGISPPTPIIQIALFERPPKLPLSPIENMQEKCHFSHSQTKAKAGELVAIILKTDTPLSSTFS